MKNVPIIPVNYNPFEIFKKLYFLGGECFGRTRTKGINSILSYANEFMAYRNQKLISDKK
ncbi:hypothetical protein BpHYR1_050879 [Brachionus plicatilis]|uniref:Uncharacterized protein n=1 Tax=Brachionus plicatilis TaxID=10195 RepID=A0A3M7P4M9_BRAPC|nr:hypothetical protein BpHYR1_050879 [Brachionus plicatilis]